MTQIHSTRFRTKTSKKPLQIVSGLFLAGGFIGATVILLGGPFTQEYQSERIAEAAPRPAWAQQFPTPPATHASAQPDAGNNSAPNPQPIVEVAHEEEVAATRPVVALENEEREIDQLAEARRFMDEGDLRNAYTALRKHLYLQPPTREVLLQVGQLGRELGELALAEQALLDAVALDPTGADLQTELARVLLEANELPRARIAARQAIRLDGQDSMAWNVAGRVALAQSEFDRAEAAFQKAVELDPMNPVIHNNAGLLYLHTKQAVRAIDSLETAVELYDNQAPAFVYNNLGLAHEQAGHYEEAREAFEEALLVSPFYARAKVNLRRVETTIATIAEQKAFQTAQGVNTSETEGEEPSDLPLVGDDG